jgi:hypothetical protein
MSFLSRLSTLLLVAVVLPACPGDDEPGPDPILPTVDAAVPDAATTTHCVGEPSSCDSFDFDWAGACVAQTGCVDERKCRPRFEFSCFDLTTFAECNEVGCTWAEECGGPGICFTYRSPGECAEHDGCHWDSFCDPLSRPSEAYCGQFAGEDACVGDAACEWGYDTCSGSPAACNTRTDEVACAAHEGCSWQP